MAFARTKAPPFRSNLAVCYRCDATIQREDEAVFLFEPPDYLPEKPAFREADTRRWMGVLDDEGNKGCILKFICRGCAPEFSFLKEYEYDAEDEASPWIN